MEIIFFRILIRMKSQNHIDSNIQSVT